MYKCLAIKKLSLFNMMAEEEPEEQQINLLKKVLGTLEDIRNLFEKSNQKDVGGESAWAWIDNKELEKLLGLHERTLATWRENGTLGFTRIGKKIFYNRKDIEQLLWKKFSREVKL